MSARLLGAGRANVPYEVLFVNDGSCDRSAALLKDQFRPGRTRVILFNTNCGQHMAIMASNIAASEWLLLDAD